MWKNLVQPDRPRMALWRVRIACWIPNATKYTLRICNTYCCSTATMVKVMRLNVTLYIHCLTCSSLFLWLWTMMFFKVRFGSVWKQSWPATETEGLRMLKRVKWTICDNTYKGFLIFMSRVYSGTHPIKSSLWQKRLARNASVIFMCNLPNAAVWKRADGRMNLIRK
jgi:hypothetical protein